MKYDEYHLPSIPSTILLEPDLSIVPSLIYAFVGVTSSFSKFSFIVSFDINLSCLTRMSFNSLAKASLVTSTSVIFWVDALIPNASNRHGSNMIWRCSHNKQNFSDHVSRNSIYAFQFMLFSPVASAWSPIKYSRLQNYYNLQSCASLKTLFCYRHHRRHRNRRCPTR